MNSLEKLKKEMLAMANPEKAKLMAKYFQVYPGGYGEGDAFIGLTVPAQRDLSRRYFKDLSLEQSAELLLSKIHEERLTAVFILVLKYARAKNEAEKEQIVKAYIESIKGVNNWDIVDSSAHKILGPFLENKDKSLLYDFLDSGDLWKQRVAIIATMHYIDRRNYTDIFIMAEKMLNHKHDLIHKALGWMLREVGKKDFNAEYDFLAKHYKKMPRTMLRYAIEKFDEELRRRFLKGEI
ncbi:MAG: DNA alkylation repair protein [Bacteroidetes bacterium]|nr:DNA alkylation repair protein [Bacteroidota bacterium]